MSFLQYFKDAFALNYAQDQTNPYANGNFVSAYMTPPPQNYQNFSNYTVLNNSFGEEAGAQEIWWQCQIHNYLCFRIGTPFGFSTNINETYREKQYNLIRQLANSSAPTHTSFNQSADFFLVNPAGNFFGCYEIKVQNHKGPDCFAEFKNDLIKIVRLRYNVPGPKNVPLSLLPPIVLSPFRLEIYAILFIKDHKQTYSPNGVNLDWLDHWADPTDPDYVPGVTFRGLFTPSMTGGTRSFTNQITLPTGGTPYPPADTPILCIYSA